MALITPKDIADIKGTLAELAPYTEEPIVYKRFDHIDAGDPVMGKPDEAVYISTETTAMVENLTAEEIANSAGYYLLGDLEFTIRMEQEPSDQDRIQYQGFIWSPKHIDKMFLGEVLWWEIRARKE